MGLFSPLVRSCSILGSAGQPDTASCNASIIIVIIIVWQLLVLRLSILLQDMDGNNGSYG